MSDRRGFNDKVKFGQGDSVKIYIEPPSGYVGTRFRLKVSHVDANSEVSVSIKAPDKKQLIFARKGQLVYDDTSKADRSGNVLVEKVAEQDWEPGTYTFIVTYLHRGKSDSQNISFTILS